MTPAEIGAALALASGVGLVLPTRRRFAEQPRAAPVGDESLLRRHRLLLACLSGAGVAVFFGGVVGVVAGVAAGCWSWRALGRAESPAAARRRRAVDHDLPPAVDLFAGALRTGAAPGPALGLVAEAIGGPVGEAFAGVQRRLELGTDPAVVWRDLGAAGPLSPVGRALARAHDSGASVATAADRLATELRERGAAQVEARARSVSSRAAAPLGACFLPAFVLLGIVPLVAGLLGGLQLFG
ncbi:MAG: type secretion system protein [Nocardioidaceae bacterium]|nr:type secretion system protein [Nocardioidaceae bacterium]